MEIIKEIIGKTKIINNNLPEKLIINENILLDKKEIENEFNNFFYKNLSKAGREHRTIEIFFESYIDSINTKSAKQVVSINELMEPFIYLKYKKSPGIDDISVKVFKRYFSVILLHYFWSILFAGYLSWQTKNCQSNTHL